LSAVCPSCSATASDWDRYCGSCGTPLARLRWHLHQDSRELGEDGRVAVRRGSHGLRLSVVNEGVVPAGLVLPAEALERLPNWVDQPRLAQLQERAITLEPGQEQVLSIPFGLSELEALFVGVDRQATPVLEAPIYLLTTLCQLAPGGWSPRPLKLSLVVAREPWFSPAASHYRFIPTERLREGLVHRVTLHNESAEDVSLEGLSLEEHPGAPPSWASDATHMAIEFLVEAPPPTDHPVLRAGESRSFELRFLNPELQGLRFFSGRLVCRYTHRQGGRIQALIQGVLGRAPTLVCDAPEPIGHPSVERDEVHSLVLKNPGDLPVQVTQIQVLKGEEPATGPDWFHLDGVTPGEVIPPGGERTVHYTLALADRPQEEFDQAWSSRRFRIHHDGAGARILERSVDAQLGVVQVPTGVFMGIDFGTSNSMVVLLRPDTRTHLALPLEGESLQLPSLMYYQGASGPGEAPFLFGSQADASAELNPANLVRSIKSVISRSPETWYHFLERSPEGAWRRRSYRPQELLDRFITELRLRAERAVSGLSMQQLRALRIGPKVRFRQAIFSHPVEVDADMKAALMRASHVAGLNLQISNIQEFIEERCIDEATSAALAYVYARLDPSSRVGVEHPLSDRERVLAVDIGGGTTDVAAVELQDLASFWEQDVEQVSVELHATAGDPLWGGDDLDLLLAEWILDELREQSARAGGEIQAQEIFQAAGFRSFGEYFNGYRARHPKREGALEQAQALYNRAVEVLRKAEAAKCKLSELERVEIRFSDQRWPREPGATEPEKAGEFRVALSRERFERAVREQARGRIALLERACAAADWDWESLSTVLFTGQGTRVPCVREELLQFISGQRSEGAPKLLVVQPQDRSGFDPKRCVGMGASIWGTREEGEWIKVRRRMNRELTHDVQTRWGPFHFRTIDGLERGTPLPACAVHAFRKPRSTLELFRDGQLHMSFTFPEPVSQVELVISGPGDIRAIAGELDLAGEVPS
jgi:molecular chaperone DnaK (HSP70)